MSTNQITKYMKLLDYDKLLHLVAGIYICMFFSILINNVIGLIMVIIIAIGKELIWDNLMKKGTPEIMDAVWTAIGGLSVFVFSILCVK